MTPEELAIIRAGQEAWDARRAEIQRALPSQSFHEAAIYTNGELYGRPEVPGEDNFGAVLKAVVPIVFLASAGAVIAPAAIAALKAPAGLKALNALRKGLNVLGIDSPGDALHAISSGLGVFHVDKITPVEGIRVAIAVLQEVEKAMADGKFEINEVLPVVSAAFKELTDGDSPNTP